MNQARWRRIEQLFNATLALPGDKRAALLDTGCAADTELRAELDSLVKEAERPDKFLSEATFTLGLKALVAGEASNLIGTSLGPYMILSILGRGGMGEVYLAHDPRLGRKVAIKLLPLSLTQDQERVKRFQHEARAASAISHPNVAHIYEIGEAEGRPFTAMEYVDGVTLRERLQQGPMKLGEALDIALQVAAALRAAHEGRVIHRDVKPENIVIRRDSLVKVLDFGLAKLMETETPTPSMQAQTLAQVETNPGTILGTVQYMSPEQARGLVVDERTDIWSLGCVLYEMVMGEPAFNGSTASDVIAEILKSEPPLFRTPVANFPPELNSILRKMLSKPREARFQSATEARKALQHLHRELGESEASFSAATPWANEELPGPPVETERSNVRPTDRSGLVQYLSLTLQSISAEAKRPLAILGALAILAIVVAAAGYFRWRPAVVPNPPTARITSLAVLPFKQLGGNETDEYLSQGMADALINKLSRMRDLNVRPIGAVLKYSTTESDAVSVGLEQKVDAVFEGNILKSGDRIRMTTRLIDSRTGKAIWTESYEDKLSDIFAVEDRISEKIARSIAPQFDANEQQVLTKHFTANPDAYQLYLKGRYFWNKRTVDGLNKGADYFERAIQIDPNYSLAYAGLADCYSLLGSFLGVSPHENLTKAKETAVKAIVLDDSLAEAHASLAKLRMDVDWNFTESEREFRRAIELNPGYVTAHHWYGDIYLSAMGRDEEAISEMKRALELDPTSLILNTDLGWCYIAARRWDEAVKQLKLTIEMDPNFWPAYHNLAQAYAATERFDEALETLRQAAKLKDAPAQIATLGYVYGRAGQTVEAEGILKQEKARYEQGQGSAYNIAVIYGGLGKKDEAFAWLTRDFESHDTALLSIKVDPLLAPLRDDQRFSQLEQRFHFP